MYAKTRLRLTFLAITMLAAAGCANKPPPPTDLVVTGRLRAEGGADDAVVVSTPRIIDYDAAREINGSVTRRADWKCSSSRPVELFWNGFR